jgi:aminoglycoside 6'-N-acetyltransferase
MNDLRFRRLVRADFPMLGGWLAQPHVRRWWNHDFSPAAVEADFGAVVGGHDPTEMFIAAHGGRPFGLIQRYTFADNPGYREELAPLVSMPPHALSIDYLVGPPALTKRGYGTEMIRAAVAAVWEDYPAASAIIVPVVAANRPSWRALEKAGFSRCAEGALAPDNPIDDDAHFIYRIDR